MSKKNVKIVLTAGCIPVVKVALRINGALIYYALKSWSWSWIKAS